MRQKSDLCHLVCNTQPNQVLNKSRWDNGIFISNECAKYHLQKKVLGPVGSSTRPSIRKWSRTTKEYKTETTMSFVLSPCKFSYYLVFWLKSLLKKSPQATPSLLEGHVRPQGPRLTIKGIDNRRKDQTWYTQPWSRRKIYRHCSPKAF